MLFKLSNLNSNLALTLGYLNPALNNSALGEERQSGRAITQISSCQVNTTSRRGITQLGISFGSIFFYFPMEVAGDYIHGSRRKSPVPGR